MGPFFGSLFGPLSLQTLSLWLQVALFLQWVQWLWQEPFRGRQVVCINIDETPVYRQLQPRKGYVVMLHKKNNLSVYSRVPLRDRRGQSTLLGCICDDPEVQKVLPQFVLTNDKNLTRAEKCTGQFACSAKLGCGNQGLGFSGDHEFSIDDDSSSSADQTPPRRDSFVHGFCYHSSGCSSSLALQSSRLASLFRACGHDLSMSTFRQSCVCF